MIGAPIFDRDGQVIALLWAYNRSATVFTAGDEAVISGLAQQAALAIGTARGMEGERHRARETAALLEIAQVCASTLELRPLLRAVARQVAQALGAERCTINLWRGGVLVPVMAQFADGHVDTALWERFKEMGKDGRAGDSRGSGRGADAPAGGGGGHERVGPRHPRSGWRPSASAPSSWCRSSPATASSAPCRSTTRAGRGRGRPRIRISPPPWPPRWPSRWTGPASTRKSAQRASEVQTLSAVGETLASTLDLQEVLDAIADSATKVTGAQRAVVFEMDESAGHLLARAVRGMPVDKGYVVQPGQGAAGAAVAQRAPVWSADVVADPPPGYDSLQVQAGVTLAEMATRFGYRAVLAVPVVSREAVLGAVCIYWDEVHRPDEREIRLLSALARQAAIAMENARLVADLRRTLDDLKAAQDDPGARRHPARGGRAGGGRVASPQQPHGGGARTDPAAPDEEAARGAGGEPQDHRARGGGRRRDGAAHPGLRAHGHGRRRRRPSISTRSCARAYSSPARAGSTRPRSAAPASRWSTSR